MTYKHGLPCARTLCDLLLRGEELKYEKKKIDKVFEERQQKDGETREAEAAIEELRKKAHDRLQVRLQSDLDLLLWSRLEPLSALAAA